MPITFTCACSQSITLPDDTAGTEVKCPACKKPVTVPAAGKPVFGFKDEADDVSAVEARAAAIRAKNEKRQAAKRREELEDDDENLDPKIARRLRRDAAAAERSRPPLPPTILSGVGTVLLGLGVTAVFYFGFGRLSIYGPIVAVLGLGQIAHGVNELRQWGKDYGDS